MLFVSINVSLKKDSVIFSAFVNCNVMLCIEFSSLRLKCDTAGYFLVLLCKQEWFTKINRSVESVLEFQQNEPRNQQKIVTPMNNKVAAISKMMELPGDK